MIYWCEPMLVVLVYIPFRIKKDDFDTPLCLVVYTSYISLNYIFYVKHIDSSNEP